MQSSGMEKEPTTYHKKTRSAVGLATFAIVGALLMWYAADLVLLAFLSILFAIFLRGLCEPLSERLHLPDRAGLAIVVVLLIVLLTITGYLFSADIARQFSELTDRLPKAFAQLKETVESSDLGRQVMDWISQADRLLQRPGVLSRATGVVSATFGFLSSILVVSVGGIFLAYEPRLYIEGSIRLVHPRKRERLREVYLSLYHTMRWWLLGKAFEMVFVGSVTAIGLYFLGVQLALVLGLVAGLFAFIPYIGPILSALPAVLLALVESPQLALYVIFLYSAIQLFEGNIVTPIVEKKTVRLPPALTIFSQLLAALFFGFLGVLLASPLTAVGIVLVKMLYIEDHLESETES